MYYVFPDSVCIEESRNSLHWQHSCFVRRLVPSNIEQMFAEGRNTEFNNLASADPLSENFHDAVQGYVTFMQIWLPRSYVTKQSALARSLCDHWMLLISCHPVFKYLTVNPVGTAKDM